LDCVSQGLLEETKLFRLELTGNPIFEGNRYYKLAGFEAYAKRSKAKGDKQIQGGVKVTTT
jgi:hypothetical protein